MALRYCRSFERRQVARKLSQRYSRHSQIFVDWCFLAMVFGPKGGGVGGVPPKSTTGRGKTRDEVHSFWGVKDHPWLS